MQWRTWRSNALERQEVTVTDDALWYIYTIYRYCVLDLGLIDMMFNLDFIIFNLCLFSLSHIRKNGLDLQDHRYQSKISNHLNCCTIYFDRSSVPLWCALSVLLLSLLNIRIAIKFHRSSSIVPAPEHTVLNLILFGVCEFAIQVSTRLVRSTT